MLHLRNSGFAICAVACFALVASHASAQDAVARGLTTPRLSGYAEIAVADKYIYQGFVLESRGPVVQPYIELFGEFYSGDGFLTSASLSLMVFNSLQFHNSGRSNMADPMRTWYEFEIKPGVQLVLAKQLTFTASYRRFESPNGYYGSANGIELSLEFDDSKLLGKFALNPHVTWIAPLSANYEDSEEGHYFEFGIEPSFAIGERSRYPITVALPAIVAGGDQHYYAGRSFGFASAGVRVSVPLAFVPASAGKWNLAASATYYRLGETAAQLTNDGDRNEQLFAGVLSVEF
jgi:hypothetical protein